MSDGDDVTNGELHRRLSMLETDVKSLAVTLVEIRTTLAGQGVKVGVVWATLGVSGAALLTGLAGIVLAR